MAVKCDADGARPKLQILQRSCKAQARGQK
jgi:hypothetical protein